MNKWMIGLTALACAAPCLAKVPQKNYGQCQELYGKATFTADDRLTLEDASKKGPCVAGVAAGASTFVPSIDRKTGQVSMQETKSKKETDQAIAKFRSDSYVFSKHVAAKEVRKNIVQMRTEARSWMGWADVKAQPAVRANAPYEPAGPVYETFGSPLGGPIMTQHGAPMPPQARLHRAPPSPQGRYYRDQYGRLVPVNPLAEEGPYAIVSVPSRGVGQIGYGVRQTGRDITEQAGQNLNHLDRYGIAAPVVGLFSLVTGAIGIGTQVVGGVVEVPAHILGHGVPDVIDSDRRAAEQRDWQRQNGGY